MGSTSLDQIKSYKKPITSCLLRSAFLAPVVGLLSLVQVSCKQGPTIAEKGIITQSLHVGNGQEPQELDPHLITGASEIKILTALFEGLVAQHPEDLSPVPGVAEAWEVSEDGKIYTFHLRKNLKWSNGDSLSSNDFVYSFQRMLTAELGAANAYLLFHLKNGKAFYNKQCPFTDVGVTAINPETLRIQLEQPTPYFLNLLSHPAWFPLHKATVSKQGDAFGRATGWTRAGTLVSNGPFSLAHWKVNEHVHVVRSDHYWDKQVNRLREIYFYPTESRDAEARAYQGGQLHITEAVPVSKVGYYKENENPFLNIDPYLGTYYLQLNTRKGPLADPRVRQALSLVIDRSQIVEKITQGDQQPAWHFTPPATAGYNANIEGVKDVASAQKLLAQAGYPNGSGFPVLTYLYNTSENNKAIAEALQQMWQSSLGITVELVNQEWKVFTQSREAGSFDILRSSWIGDYLDPTTFLDVWTTESGNNFTGWGSETYDHWMEKSHTTILNNQRFKYFVEAEKLLIKDQPIIPLYFYTSVYLKHPAVKGYHPTLLNYHPWKHVYLDSKRP